MKSRLKHFAINVAKLTQQLPDAFLTKIYKGQIIRSCSSSAANYGTSQRPKSRPDIINKRKIVEEELDETMFFFLEMLEEFNSQISKGLKTLWSESEVLFKIIVASIVSSR
jgi:four helix bundle protein